MTALRTSWKCRESNPLHRPVNILLLGRISQQTLVNVIQIQFLRVARCFFRMLSVCCGLFSRLFILPPICDRILSHLISDISLQFQAAQFRPNQTTLKFDIFRRQLNAFKEGYFLPSIPGSILFYVTSWLPLIC